MEKNKTQIDYERKPQESSYEKEEDKEELDYSTQFDKRKIIKE